MLRSILRSGSDADVAKAVDYAKCIKLYPLSQAANPPATTFVDAINSVYDSTIPYDLRFFQSLDRIVQTEPWLPRDKLMIDMLKSIGIEKGKPFSPDAKSQDILNSAAREAHALLESRYEGIFTPPYFDTAGRSRRCPTISRLLRWLLRSRRVSRRQSRSYFHFRLLHAQASRGRPVLSDDRQGQERAEF